MEVSTNTDERQARLIALQGKSKQGLSDAEFAELIRLSPPGTFTKLPNLRFAGLHDFDQALANLVEIGERGERAFAAGFYVEVLALRSQSLELFLRLYLAAKPQAPTPVEPDDRRPLGALIDAVEKLGFDPTMVAAMKAFNRDRRAGIHRLLLGEASYDSLRGVCETSAGLTQQVVAAIAKEIGVVENPAGPA